MEKGVSEFNEKVGGAFVDGAERLAFLAEDFVWNVDDF